ncbi:MAG: cytochrome c oxidase subunit II [Acidobacteriia bacterium]|nr:cytochrome c oxidase subunit II [Terriglobia bacterium]
MQPGFSLSPEQASTIAPHVDHLFYFLTGVTGFFAILVFMLIFVFAIKYRRRSEDEIPVKVHEPMALETAWIGIPFGLMLIMFGWGAWIYYQDYNPPAGAFEVFVVGKQWMWKLQHPEGKREINELHVPIGVPIKLVMTSQDVIHDFFIPAFRVKQDVLPGRYTELWFKATKPGRYHLFCAQYCGTDHAHMGGWIVVMEPREYQRWLSGGEAGETMEQAGRRLFQQYACTSCHFEDNTGRCPSLRGLYHSQVKLVGGQTVTADENYIRESILDPNAKIVAGYSPVMPTFKGQISEEGILQIIAYIKSLKSPERMSAGK